MEFSVSVKDFQKQLAIASQVRSTTIRPPRPLLANVLIQADQENQRVTFTVCDLSFGIRTAIAAQVNKAGQIALPPKFLSNIVNQMPEGDLHISLGDPLMVHIHLEGVGTYKIQGMASDRYPELPDATAQRVELPTDLLLQGIRSVMRFASTDRDKRVLCGVYFQLRDGVMELAASDGHRMSLQKIPLNESEEEMPEFAVTVPTKALGILTEADASDSISISLDDQYIVFRWGNNMLTSRLLKGEYPDYWQLIPSEFAITATCDRKALMSALERIFVLAYENRNVVHLAFDSTRSQIRLAADAPDFGSGHETIPCRTDQDIALTFNARYLLEGLSSIEAQEVLIQMKSPKPLLVGICPSDNIQHQHFLMPI